jgi:hypothetical protein
VLPVRWPFGFAALRDDEGLALLGERGEVIGWPGDRVQLGGGIAEAHVVACGGVGPAEAPESP